MFINSFKNLLNLNSANTPIKGKEEDLFSKVGEKGVETLLKIQDGDLRTQKLTAIGEDFLSRSKSWATSVNWQQWGLMMNSLLIRGTSLEGGDSGEAIQVWSTYLHLWQKGEALFFPLNLTQAQLLLIEQEFKNFLYFTYPPKDTPLSNSEITSAADSVHKKVISKLQKDKKFYAQFGFRYGSKNDGHSIGWKFVAVENGVMVYALNSGDGSQLHPLLDQTTSQDFCSYRFFPIFIEKKDFEGPLGLAAFGHLIRYQTDPYDQDDLPYEGSDIYDIWLTIGKVMPNVWPDPESYKVRQQRSGKCTEKAVKNCIRDILLDQGISQAEIRKIFLNAFLCALVSGYHDYCRDQNSQKRIQLRDATEKLGLWFLKLDLSDAEKLVALSIVQEILKKTPNIKQKQIVITLNPQAPPKLNETFPQLSIDTQIHAIHTDSLTTKPGKVSRIQYSPSFQIANAATHLKEWLTILDQLEEKHRFSFLYRCSFSLPIPSFESDEWNKVDPTKVQEILTLLTSLFHKGVPEFMCKDVWFEQFLLVHTFYAIADKLARLCPWTHLDSYASPFIPLMHPIYPQNFVSIPVPLENCRYSKLMKYFEKGIEVAKEQVIFPVERILSTETFQIESQKGRKTQGAHHILYLAQFEKNTKLFSAILWRDETKKRMPSEYHSLYYFAFLSTLFFTASDSGNGIKVPPQLEFEPIRDHQGRQALQVVCEDSLFGKQYPTYEKNRERYFLSEFQNMQVKSTHSEPSIPRFFDKEMVEMGVNAASCSRIEKNAALMFQIDEPLFRDLCRINTSFELKPAFATEWISGQLIHLKNPSVQCLLDHCFFAPSRLEEWLLREPASILHLRNIVQKGLEYCRDNLHHLPSILFLIRMGMQFEVFHRYVAEDAQSASVWQSYKKVLEKLLEKVETPTQQQEIICHLLYIDSQGKKLKLEELFLFFERAFHFLAKGDSLDPYAVNYPWLLKKIPFLAEQFIYSMLPLTINEEFHQHVTLLLKKLFPNLEEQPFIKTNCLESYRYGDLVINFFHLKIDKKDQGSYFLATDKIIERSDKILLQEFKEPMAFWRNNNGFFNDNLKIAWTNGKLVIHQKLSILGKEKWFQNTSFPVDDRLDIDFLSYDQKLSFRHLIPIDREKGDPDIVVYDSEKKVPYLRIDLNPSGAKLTRIDEKGNSLPLVLVNFHKAAFDPSSFFGRLIQISPSGRFLCFIEPKSGRIDELNLFEMNLSFVRKNNRLECNEYKGFWLEENLLCSELHPFNALFVLQNDLGAKKIILSPRGLKIGSGGLFSRVAEVEEKNFGGASDYGHYEYELDPISGHLKSTNSLANLHLVRLLKIQGEYAKASKYVKKAQTTTLFTYQEKQLLEKIFDLKDASAEAAGLDMQLIFLFIENRQQCIETRFKRDSTGKELHFQCIRRYTEYLGLLSSNAFSVIPKALRLTVEQEKVVIAGLIQFLKNEKEEISQLFTIRFALLYSERKEVPTNISPKSIALRPPAYSSLLSPSKFQWICSRYNGIEFPYNPNELKKRAIAKPNLSIFPNRLHPETLAFHFVEYYEKARLCPKDKKDPFDFTLLALLKHSLRRTYSSSHIYCEKELAHLLFYVRYLPNFEHLSLADCTNEALSAAIFGEILRTVRDIESEPIYKKFKAFLEANEQFDYSKNYTLPTLPIPRVAPPLASSISNLDSGFKKNHAPFARFVSPLFKKEKIPTYSGNMTLDTSLLKDKNDPILQDLAQNFELGTSQLKDKARYRYTLLEAASFDTVSKEMQTEKAELLKELQSKRKEIMEIANAPYNSHRKSLNRSDLSKEIHFRLTEVSRQKIKIYPETIMLEVVLKNNYQLLKQEASLLTDAEMERLIFLTKIYYFHLCHLMVIENSLKLIEKLKVTKDPQSVQSLGEYLDYTFSYDPILYPEISYFQIATGKVARPEQVTFHVWAMEGIKQGKKNLGQLAAGAGKTSFLIPMLCLGVKRLGKVPVVMTTQAIYSVDKENLSDTLQSLGFKLSFLEVGLHMKISDEDVKHISRQLSRCTKEEMALFITPNIYYALSLFARHALLKEKNEEKIKWFSKIENFFKNECVLLADESHRNLDSLSRSIYGIGDFMPVSHFESELLLKWMKPLLGIEKVTLSNGRLLSDMVRLNENRQGTPSEEDLLMMQTALAEHFLNQYNQFSKEERKEFSLYLTDKRQPQPELLKKWGESTFSSEKLKADEVALFKYFLQDLLKMVVSLRTGYDHTQSMFSNEEFETPCHQRTPTSAQFEDYCLTICLTIKALSQRHLSQLQVQTLISEMVKKDWQEQSLYGMENTPSANNFASWVKESPFSKMHLRDVPLSNFEIMKKLWQHLKGNTPALFHYAHHHIMPQIGVSSDLIYVTPSHLLNKMGPSILLTATPYLKEIYPIGIEEFNKDSSFDAHVLLQSLHKNNQSIVYPENAATFFDFMKKEHQNQFETIDVMLDAGGFFADYKNHEVATLWLESSDKLDGVLFFKQAESLKVDSDERINLFVRTTDKKHPFKLIDSIRSDNLEEELAKKGLNYRSLKLGTYYDAAHTQSANIRQKQGARALIFGGDSLGASRKIQAYMRLRGFLLEEMDQRVVWVLQKDLAGKIAKEKTSFLNWTIKNEVEEIKKRIILSAYQDIAYLIESPAEEELRMASSDPKKQIAIGEKYYKGLVETNKLTFYQKYGNNEIEENTEKVLWDFAQWKYASFGYTTSLEQQGDLKDKISAVIQRAAMKVKKIASNSCDKIAKEVEVHQQLKKETEQIQYRPRHFDPIYAEKITGDVSLYDPHYFSILDIRKVQNIFSEKTFAPNFFFEVNQLKTAQNSGVSLDEEFLKPIDFLQILILKDKWVAIAHSNDFLAKLMIEMKKCPNGLILKHKAFLITASGKMVLRGSGALEPTKEEIDKILASQELDDLLIDVALLKGKIYNPQRLKERMKNWPGFQEFWERIVKAQPNEETADQEGMKKLISEVQKLDNNNNLKS